MPILQPCSGFFNKPSTIWHTCNSWPTLPSSTAGVSLWGSPLVTSAPDQVRYHTGYLHLHAFVFLNRSRAVTNSTNIFSGLFCLDLRKYSCLIGRRRSYLDILFAGLTLADFATLLKLLQQSIYNSALIQLSSFAPLFHSRGACKGKPLS